MAVTSNEIWIVGRVVYGAGLENQRTERFRGFESYTIRHFYVGECANSLGVF